MARLPKKERDIRDSKILADWKAGCSQNQLAKNYDVSPATINKICKGVEQTNLDIVNSQIAINTELVAKSECEVNSIHSIVNEKTKHLRLINDNATKLANKLNLMTDEISEAQELKHLVEANDKLAITLKVAERHAPKTEINNNNAQQNNDKVIKVEYS